MLQGVAGWALRYGGLLSTQQQQQQQHRYCCVCARLVDKSFELRQLYMLVQYAGGILRATCEGACNACSRHCA